jgi:hypothetical protein
MLIFPHTFTKTPRSCRTYTVRLITLMIFLDFDFVNLFIYMYYTSLDGFVEREHAVEQLFRYYMLFNTLDSIAP